MPDLSYVMAALAIAFVITVSLRAVPFLLLKPLRESTFVRHMAFWMPAGILCILAATTFRSSAFGEVTHLWEAAVATAVTVVVHLGFGRRTLLSVGAGTAVFVTLVNLV
ncbi:branched-chain amino acid transporter permease [Tessaracoccus antarcticus]|uniref:Branched-chain amino acid transporter AzlD n=1 Tax=Tessaracoccus antarcticus TaxID=2479848 RepID=A0A3M0G566_9ACTN|nr:AzlD domain-containing protein [Tessaracoccus antarcticus]RMB60171.1 branched-chain amino acid transporter AzlD [Tessaracoccus antarcticus]